MFIILVLYVNNVFVTSESMEEINKLKAHLAKAFDMKYLKVAKQILGI